MPFFNFRRGGSASAPNAGAAAQPASAEVLRKRARHRLIGAAVLVLIGVVGFPLLFDTQPRPVAVDIPIVIPGKGTVPPLVAPSATATAPSAPAVSAAPAAGPSTSSTSSAAATPKPAERVAAAASLAPEEEIVSSRPAPDVTAAKPETRPETRPEAKPAKPAKPEVHAEPKPAARPPATAAATVDDGARARALLNGAPLPAAPKPAATATAAASTAAEGRFIVQIGAFAETTKAQEARMKVERAGLKTYAQVADTKDGKRTRVRVGPFASRAEAEKAASRIKSLDLPAAILTL